MGWDGRGTPWIVVLKETIIVAVKALISATIAVVVDGVADLGLAWIDQRICVIAVTLGDIEVVPIIVDIDLALGAGGQIARRTTDQETHQKKPHIVPHLLRSSPRLSDMMTYA